MVRLALALGQPLSTIRAMSSSDLSLFMAYDNKYCIGPERLDFGLAQIAFMIASIFSKNKLDIKRFMPFVFKDTGKITDPAAMEKAMRDYTIKVGGRVVNASQG